MALVSCTTMVATSALFMGWALGAPGGPPNTPPGQRFKLEEATIASIHGAFKTNQLTCQKLVQLYIDRIDAYDLQGPSLRSIITVNPQAMATAADMDQQYRRRPRSVGPLHCIPVILKDNYNTNDMPTTGGNITLIDSIPPEDAFTVQRLRDAGALILAKANMTEFARGGTSISGLAGQVLNPYDLTRTAGGSRGDN